MALIIGLGTNLGDRNSNLEKAREHISHRFSIIQSSRIYQSGPVDYQQQPDFLNQVIECQKPQEFGPDAIVNELLSIEEIMGRERKVDKGPRVIDLDLLFYGLQHHDSKIATVPHPRLFKRAFVVLPLTELPFYDELIKFYEFPREFNHSAFPVEDKD